MKSNDNATPTAGAANAPATPAATAVPARTGNPARKKALLGVTALVLLAGIAYGIYYLLVLDHYESTDNAYVQGNVVQLTPQVGGTVVAINADETDFVKAGTTLVKLDPADAHVALEQAEAQLAQAVREARILYVNNNTYNAQISARVADVARARSDVARAQDDVNRRAPLVASGAVGAEEFNHANAQLAAARTALAAAEAGATAAREQLASNQSLTQGVAVEDHPNVLRAAARVREAYLALARVDLIAPVDGHIAKRSVQLGQRVQPGVPLMSVVSLGDLWVDANFKESQLRSVRIGQPVTLEADVYGKRVVYHGTIEGLGAGTGSAFALLPAQNATGNWIKVVQRVPVRIALDPKELAEHPLRVGLSMEAKVDVSNVQGPILSDATRQPTRAATQVFDQVNAGADAEVQRIIAANLGRAARPATAAPSNAATHGGPAGDQGATHADPASHASRAPAAAHTQTAAARVPASNR
ncbi:HlyD family efflux transporter periplasmic adaptor subunit [Piscinibacter koreensis]|uniref:HlyD family efflux transporter periplasmic adaptor subunit n=1 Tax=Piscinibacter koreensis TaxID=2742824 RepID=A0A7Y6NPQ3_9BURK|nr:HlyD family efflux transporter periplasmic adaptor subunit [Schlegelella koreensis]NUZ07075.1 HlyD family efflux transporter periplasmic adaptor subunit [Schlegelella koreensis]